MPQRRGETEQQWMDRIRRERDMMPLRARSAVAYLNTTRDGGDGPTALVAFMEIFHPEYPQDKVLAMASDIRRRNGR